MSAVFEWKGPYIFLLSGHCVILNSSIPKRFLGVLLTPSSLISSRCPLCPQSWPLGSWEALPEPEGPGFLRVWVGSTGDILPSFFFS